MKTWQKNTLQLLAAMFVALIGTQVLRYALLFYMAGVPALRWPSLGGVENSTDTTPIALQIGDKHFRIPRNYLWDKSTWKGGEMTDLSLWALLPDFEGYTEANQAEFDRLGWHQEIRFRLELQNSPSGAYSSSGTRRSVYQRKIDMLISFINPKQAYTIKNLPTPYGLIRQQFIPEPRFEFSEMYVGKTADGRFYWVKCRRDADVPSPSCSSRLEYSVHVTIDYSFAKNRLGDWQAIDDGLIALLRRFEIHPPKEKS